MKDVVIIPRMSEKAYAMSQREGIKTYVMEVPLSANKHTVARAISAQFEVTVTSVRTTISKGKVKRTVRKGGRTVTGTRSDFKKAYVTLKAGDELPIFVEEAAEDAKAAEVQAKAGAKAAKKAKKESK
jgi:large subunit ribosomal protein L23